MARLAFAAIGGFLIGLALDLWKTRTLRADVATWSQLATDPHAENSRLRLGASLWGRRP